jgi:NAD(P)-dependent dehydrogenase (short-subunit alcohol dehydrogenase family)
LKSAAAAGSIAAIKAKTLHAVCLTVLRLVTTEPSDRPAARPTRIPVDRANPHALRVPQGQGRARITAFSRRHEAGILTTIRRVGKYSSDVGISGRFIRSVALWIIRLHRLAPPYSGARITIGGDSKREAQSTTMVFATEPRAALVTGGVKRIGGAIARALAGAGYGVAMHVRHVDADAEALVADMNARGLRAAVVDADFADANAVAMLVQRSVAAIGPLTVLVNCAAEFMVDDFGTLEREQWDRHFAVNLRAPVFLAQAFAAQVPAGRDAAIVNITDQRVRKKVPRQFSYTLSKCALDAATTLLAQALAPRVRVNAVAPGPTLPSPRQDPAAFAAQSAALPLGHGPRPEDIAAAVLYLIGAPRVTGETIAVDGGQHIAWKTPDVWGIEE